MDRWPQTNCCPLWALIYSDRGNLCDYWGLFWSKWLRFSTVCCILAQWRGSESHSFVSDSLQTRGLYSPWNSPGQNTRVGSLSLLQGIFPIQELNWGFLHSRWILSQLSYFLVLQFHCNIIRLYIIWKSLCYMVLYICFPHDASLPGIFYPSPPLESWETYVHSSQFAHGKWVILFPTSLSPKSDEPLILLYSSLCYIF